MRPIELRSVELVELAPSGGLAGGRGGALDGGGGGAVEVSGSTACGVGARERERMREGGERSFRTGWEAHSVSGSHAWGFPYEASMAEVRRASLQG